MHQISLNEEDFLTYNLYTASKSKRIKKKRISEWILTTVIFLGLSVILNEEGFLEYYFMILAGLTLFLFPIYTRWRYKNHYLKYIRENFKNRFGEVASLEFSEDLILTKDRTGEAKTNISEIEELNEISTHLFIKLRTGQAFIIPKRTVTFDTFKKELLENVVAGKLVWNEELKWRWR